MFRFLATRAGLLCLALAPLVASPQGSAATAQTGASAPTATKVGIVNMQKAMADSDELKKASAAVEAKYKPRQDEITKLQNDLQSIQQQLQSGKVNEAAAADLQSEGQRKQRDLQRLSDDLQQDFERDRQDILGKASQKMQQVVSKLAEEKGLDLVVDVTQTIYFKPALDITAEATAAYNKAYPAK